MRNILAIALLSAVGLAISAASCGGNGDSSSSTEGGSDTTSSTTSTTSNTHIITTSSVFTTSSVQMMDCTNLLNGTPCADCTEAKCCDKLNECLDDPDCNNCLLEPGQGCEDNETYAGVVLCGQANCDAECSPVQCDAPGNQPSMGSCWAMGPAAGCNPFTNQPCAADELCLPSQMGLQCFQEPNGASLCGECGPDSAWCDAGQVCLLVGCASLCCNDGDCGDAGPGSCIKGLFADFGLPDMGYCGQPPIQIPCDGPPDDTCDTAKEVCGCVDCNATAYCNKDQCTNDGTCDIMDSCTCPDCDNSANCLCNYDTVCNSFTESCKCPDCWDNPNCADNPKDKCTNDGKCEPTEFCSCIDCIAAPGCNDPNYCSDNGDCVAYEGCICNDCKMEPGCMMGSSGAGP